MNYADLQREHDMADVSLRLVFGERYTLLSSTDMQAVRADYIKAFRANGCTVGQYAARVGGRDNLACYAKGLRP
jgi:hypothetical protein